jgi:4-amino-4-deoxychorismate lyase
MDPRVLAVLGRGVVPLDLPLLRADDLGVSRGDGVFETMHVREGSAWLLGEHLSRMASSSARLDLALPDHTALADLVAAALEAWPSDREATVKLVCTRGPEGEGPPTVYALVTPIALASLTQRRAGITVVTAPLGFTADARASAPWLLGGVKSLSYGVNMAALRWAAGQGCDDALFVSSDGEILEGPTSSVVWLDGETLCTVSLDTGILPGLTAAYLLDHAAEAGLTGEYRRGSVDDLLDSSGAWLCSSGRGIARITELDGKPLAPAPLTDTLREILGFAL